MKLILFRFLPLLFLLPASVEAQSQALRQTPEQVRAAGRQCIARERALNHLASRDQLAALCDYVDEGAVNPDAVRFSNQVEGELTASGHRECIPLAARNRSPCRDIMRHTTERVRARNHATLAAYRRPGCDGSAAFNRQGEPCCEYSWRHEIVDETRLARGGAMREPIPITVCDKVKSWRTSCSGNRSSLSTYHGRYRTDLIACNCGDPRRNGGPLPPRWQCHDYRLSDARLDEDAPRHHHHHSRSNSSSAKGGVTAFPFGAPAEQGSGASAD